MCAPFYSAAISRTDLFYVRIASAHLLRKSEIKKLKSEKQSKTEKNEQTSCVPNLNQTKRSCTTGSHLTNTTYIWNSEIYLFFFSFLVLGLCLLMESRHLCIILKVKHKKAASTVLSTITRTTFLPLSLLLARIMHKYLPIHIVLYLLERGQRSKQRKDQQIYGT